MSYLSLNDIKICKLDRISVDGGDVMHFLKSNDKGYKKFGEIYFSWVNMGVVKAWKKHNKMTLNLVVPYGQVKFVFHLPSKKEIFRVEEIGNLNYNRITVPPGIWFGFKGIGKNENLVSNFADILHHPDEVERVKKENFLYKW